MQGFGWVTERGEINHMTWEDSCVTASSGAGRAYHPEVKAGTSRESGLDVAFSGSVCLGHEESGLGGFLHFAHKIRRDPFLSFSPKPPTAEACGIFSVLPLLYVDG